MEQLRIDHDSISEDDMRTSPTGAPPAVFKVTQSTPDKFKIDGSGPQRDTLMSYRPSDYNDATRSTMARDSLMAEPNDMSNVLGELDDHYRMTINTKTEMEENLSPLLKAAKNGDLTGVMELLAKPNTDILRRDPHHGQTALHFAIRGGHINIITALCADEIVRSIIDVPDNRRNTPLHLATAKSRRITKMLLEHGASVDSYNMRNQTALGVHVLTTKKDDPILTEMLLQFRADPNAIVEQSTLLHAAIDRSMVEVACRLVRHGARLDMKDENGKMVFEKVNKKLLKKLISKIAYPPVWVPNEERANCMLCSKKFSKIGVGVRRHHCRHCGRLCCGECAHLSIECYKFPKAFHGRLTAGSKANKRQKRVCKTCYGVFKERQVDEGQEESEGNKFYKRVVNYTWDEMQGQHNAPAQSS